MEAEALKHGDIAFVGVFDSRSTACVGKSFAWFTSALQMFPRAAFVAKTDDDSLNSHVNLVALLHAARESMGPLVYAGWPQFTSFLVEHNVGCGWALDPARALSQTNVTKLGGVWTNCNFCVNHPFCYIRGQSTGARAPLSFWPLRQYVE